MRRVCVADYERAAEELLPPAWQAYLAGGACDERTLRDNVDAFARVRLRPRVLAGVGEVSTTTTVLGTDVSVPVLVAPMAYLRGVHDDGDAGMARAAAAAGTVMCVSTFATLAFDAVGAAAPGAQLFYQVYPLRDRGRTADLVAAAVEAGARALLLTVDVPVVGKRERGGGGLELDIPAEWSPVLGGARASALGDVLDPALDWAYLEQLVASVPVPVVVKGVLTAEDAVLSAEHGAAGVVVSNHGGRQLDGVPASIAVLPEIVEAAGDRLEILLDSGVRRGTDVATALALGARAVLVGRPAAWGLAADGQEGARAVLELLRAELRTALALLGVRTPDALEPAHVDARGLLENV